MKTSYTPAPEVPPEARERYQAMLEVLSGTTTVSEAARRLGMSRNHFQTLLHRGLEGLLAGISPGRPGRPGKPEREASLERELAQLKKQNESLEERLGMMDRLMGVAAEMARGSARARSPTTRAKKTTSPEKKDDDEPVSRRDHAVALRAAGLPYSEVARVLAVSLSTARRWLTSSPRGPVSRSKRVSDAVLKAAAEDVRALRGLVGAESLRRAHEGLSRRAAARVKRTTLRAMERERQAATARVTVLEPGVVRGFDAMHVDGRYVLVSADAAVPYRTSLVEAARYDGAAVAQALDDDFVQNGAPLVVRMDRASVHRCPEVTAVLRRHRVTVLHGPPRHPRFYGQLERQNREHRAWLNARTEPHNTPLQAHIDALRDAVNERWCRRSLGFQTAGARWRARRRVVVDRDAFMARVAASASALRSSSDEAIISEDLATRLAIERTLGQMNLLRIESGSRVLGD